MYCMECRKYVGLTLTWDVLKRMCSTIGSASMWINFNMGCIETTFRVIMKYFLLLINFNMGCIETIAYTTIPDMRERLTLTWDVLKRACSAIGSPSVCRINFNMGCIETNGRTDTAVCPLKINFNMGCIETRKQK